MALKTMKDLLVDHMNELYAAERHASELLPKLAKNASSPELASMLRAHAADTKGHVDRLDAAFKDIGERPRPARAESSGMKGLAKDCLEMAGRANVEPHVRDAAIIAGVQHIEHDEIAGYGCARTWAEMLGHAQAASRLQATLAEERKADAELSRLAAEINKAAPV